MSAGDNFAKTRSGKPEIFKLVYFLALIHYSYDIISNGM